MKHIILSFLVLVSLPIAFANEGQLRASSETIEMLRNEIILLKLQGISLEKSRDPRCDDDDYRRPSRPVSCVQQCVSRSSFDGRCLVFGADYCAVDASCIQKCKDRSAFDGRCLAYDSDFCGFSPSCKENCTNRSATDGRCLSYGPDVCR
jgi:hypothetical protein